MVPRGPNGQPKPESSLKVGHQLVASGRVDMLTMTEAGIDAAHKLEIIRYVRGCMNYRGMYRGVIRGDLLDSLLTRELDRYPHQIRPLWPLHAARRPLRAPVTVGGSVGRSGDEPTDRPSSWPRS